jgi:Fur family ferric uptake transcriptional regulator
MTHNKINYLEIFHENGYRFTKQRQAILEAICQADGHETVAEIYYRAKELDEGIDRSTIYRAFEVFEKLGLVIRADDVNGERVYEMVKEQPHHHLICKQCGHDIEIKNRAVDEFYQYLQNEYDYEVVMDHLIVFGVCSRCSR